MHHEPLFYLFGNQNLPVWGYGLCIAIGLIACFGFLMFAFAKSNFNEEASDKILIIGVGAAAFGFFMAMVFQAFYNYIENPSRGFTLEGAMTFQGGLIGGVSSFLIVWNLYVFVIAPRVKKPKFLQNNMNAGLCDALPIIPIGITLAHSFGRLGCFMAGCCHGAKTEAWYGIYMWATSLPDGYGGTYGGYAKVVPTQLFECIFLAVLTVIMAVLFFKFKFKYNMGLYAIAYGVWRFCLEFVRNDHRGSLIPGSVLTPSQIISIIMVLVGVGYIFLHKFVLVKFMKHPELQPPVRNKKDGDGGVKQAVEAEPAAEEVGVSLDEESAVESAEKVTDNIDE